MPSLFIGLGPKGRDMGEEDVRKALEEHVPIQGVRLRGTCAFVDVANDDDADKLIKEMDGKFIGEARLSVQLSREKRGGGNDSHHSSGPVSLFIGLGPNGANIPEEEIRKALEEHVPVKAVRQRGTCAFVDVENGRDAQKLIDNMHGKFIGEARLSVQYSRDKRQSRGGYDDDHGRGGYKRERSRSRRSRRDSRDSRRRDSRRRRSRDRRRRSPSSESR